MNWVYNNEATLSCLHDFSVWFCWAVWLVIVQHFWKQLNVVWNRFQLMHSSRHFLCSFCILQRSTVDCTIDSRLYNRNWIEQCNVYWTWSAATVERSFEISVLLEPLWNVAIKWVHQLHTVPGKILWQGRWQATLHHKPWQRKTKSLKLKLLAVTLRVSSADITM